ncbi:MAG: CocE/NonD family hydrolase [Chloroflexota bacterium]|nr:CocE/NonD family hydrolase [Chloroflexota bacterium]
MAEHRAPLLDVRVLRDVPVPMRDGTTLRADIYHPTLPGPFPVLLMRLPYDKTVAQAITYMPPLWYARHGYIVAVQDVRGRCMSEGEWLPFVHEANDGYDTVEWAARLPGSSGRVGMYGFSYPGLAQLFAAGARPPSLATIAPAMAGSESYDGWAYRGGAFALAFNASWAVELARDTARRAGRHGLVDELQAALGGIAGLYWHLPLGSFPPLHGRDVAPYFFEWMEHQSRDAYWLSRSPSHGFDGTRTPALHIGGWYDAFLDGTLRNYTGMRDAATTEEERRLQRLVVGPWFHLPWGRVVGGTDLGPEADNRVDEIQLRWFDARLKGIMDDPNEPPVRLFVLGEHRWRVASDWPPPEARPVSYYLHSGGRANALGGNGALSRERPGDEPSDLYVYDPANPVPSMGGRACCAPPLAPMGQVDQTAVEMRNDVLVYTTVPLDRDIEVTGAITATIWAASSACDTDFTVKLVDVHPDGRALNLTDGVVRARYRRSLEVPSPIEPDQPYEYRIDAGATSNLFRRGHRIRLEVSSSNFPAIDRNPNTGQPLNAARNTDLRPALQTVFHDAARPSHVTLPIIER